MLICKICQQAWRSRDPYLTECACFFCEIGLHGAAFRTCSSINWTEPCANEAESDNYDWQIKGQDDHWLENFEFSNKACPQGIGKGLLCSKKKPGDLNKKVHCDLPSPGIP